MWFSPVWCLDTCLDMDLTCLELVSIVCDLLGWSPSILLTFNDNMQYNYIWTIITNTMNETYLYIQSCDCHMQIVYVFV